MPIPVSERKSMKSKKIIGLTLLSALLISGCTNANGGTTPVKNSTNTTINTESVESENYQYYPLPDGTLSIAVGTNKDLQYLPIPKTHHGKMVTQIADNGFANCTALKQINLPDSINMIGEKAFSGCSSLNSIKIPDGTSVIGNYAFEGCYLLPSVVIPSSVTSIGEYAFVGCSWLIIYCVAEKQPEGWDGNWNKIVRNGSDRARAEWGCGTYLGLVYRIDIINGERVATIVNYRGTESKLTIPGVIEGTKVVGIGDWAFSYCKSLTSVRDSRQRHFNRLSCIRRMFIADKRRDSRQRHFNRLSCIRRMLIADKRRDSRRSHFNRRFRIRRMLIADKRRDSRRSHFNRWWCIPRMLIVDKRRDSRQCHFNR